MLILYIYDENLKDYIGELTYSNNKYNLSFYSKSNINLLFPKGLNVLKSYDVENYLSNIIPEGKALKILLDKYKLTEYDLFKIVRILSNDFSGAFSFHEEKNLLKGDKNFEDFIISADVLYEKIKEERKHVGSFTIWNEKPRLSVAGFQPKLNVYLEKIEKENIIFLPNKKRSNFILKIDSNDEKDLVLNEFFHLTLAKKMKLSVAECFYQKIKDENILFVKRFDRKEENDQYIFKQIIDGCILLNIPVYEKYQHNDNKTSLKSIFIQSFKIMKDFNFSLEEMNDFKEHFLQQIFYNLLINNYDHHAKNISFFYNPMALVNKNKFGLTPLYDVVNVDLYPLNKQFSLHIGKAKQKKEIEVEDFVLIAEWLKIDLTFLNNVFQQMINNFKKIDFEEFYQNDLKQSEKIKDFPILKNDEMNENKNKFLIYYDEIKKNIQFYENKLKLLSVLNNDLKKEIDTTLQQNKVKQLKI